MTRATSGAERWIASASSTVRPGDISAVSCCSSGTSEAMTLTRSIPPTCCMYSRMPRAMPAVSENMLSSDATPRITPSMVRKERNLCAQISFRPMSKPSQRFMRGGKGGERAGGGRGAVRVIMHDAAIVNLDAPRRFLRDAAVVRDQHDGAPLRAQLAEELENVRAGLAVEIARGLIGKDDLRAIHQRAGDGHALHLPARELERRVLRAIGKADALDRLDRALPALARGHAGVDHRQLHVLQHGEFREQIEGLEDEADLAIAHLGEAIAARAGDIDAVDASCARSWAYRGSRAGA